MAKKIPLTQGLFAIVDDYDYDYLRQWKWYALHKAVGGQPYAARTYGKGLGLKNRHVAMHRIVLGVFDKDLIVDHINHDTLDNRKSNLRITDTLGNARNQVLKKTNTSGYKGVSWSNSIKKWRARVYVKGKETYLGGFDNKTDAAKAYDKVALKLYGEFAMINFPAGKRE